MEAVRKYWFLIALFPAAFAAYYALQKITPDKVCDYRLDRQKLEFRYCYQDGRIKECLR